MSGSRPQGGSRRFAFREAGLAACAGLVLAVTGCASARQVEIPQGADAEIVCSAWLDSFMGDPSSAPLALGARIVFVGVGDSRDPRRIVPEAMSVSGDPSFEVAEVVDGRFMHCQGAYRLEQVESEGALWSKAFFVAVDLVWDGERFRASEATIVLDSYRDEASQTMFERALASQAPYEGAFSGDGPERFYAIDSDRKSVV